MKKKLIIPVLLLIVATVVSVCVLSGCTKKNENILSNSSDGVFKYDTLSALKGDWTLVTASSVTDLSNVFTMNADADKNSYSVSVSTSSSGWAYIAQEVSLTAGAYYRIRYGVDINSISAYTSGDNYDGVYVTFLEDDDFNYNPGADQSDVSKQYLMQLDSGSGEYSVGFKAKSGGKATLALKIGSEKYPVNANLTVKKLTLERVDKAALLQTNDAGSYATDYYGTHNTFNVFYIVLGCVAIALLCYFLYFAYQRHLYKNESESSYTGFVSKISDRKGFGIILVCAFTILIRLITDVLSTAIASTYAYQIMGYNLEGLTTQAMFMAKFGTTDMLAYLQEYAANNGLTYLAPSSSPLQVYFLAFCGLLGRIFDNASGTYFATMFFIRFFCALADVGTAVVLYKLISKSTGNVGATIISVLFASLPLTLAMGSLWGYTESITMFLIVLTVYFMLKNAYVPTAITFFAACMFSVSALFLAPIVLFYTILQCIIDVKKVIPASVILVLSFAAFYALNVPFDIHNIQSGAAFNCFTRGWNEVYTGMLYAKNAFNFQAMLGNNFAAISTASTIVTIIFIVFLLALVGFAYFKFKNRMNLLLMASAFINMLFVFGNGMNPTSMYISLVLMLVYAILNKEKRIFFCFAAFAVLMFVNVSYTELFLTYSSTAVGVMPENAVMYVFAALEIVAVLYYVYIVYDIVVSRKVRKIKAMPLTYSAWLSNTGRKIKKGYYKFLLKLQRKQ